MTIFSTHVKPLVRRWLLCAHFAVLLGLFFYCRVLEVTYIWSFSPFLKKMSYGLKNRIILPVTEGTMCQIGPHRHCLKRRYFKLNSDLESEAVFHTALKGSTEF